MRDNQANRVIFAEEDNCLVFLEIIWNHAYDKSKFLKKGVLRNFLNLRHEKYQTDLNEGHFLPLGDEELEITKERWSNLLKGSGEPVEAKRLNSQFITLKKEQRKALLLNEAAVIRGGPGSGKTLVLVQSMLNYVIAHKDEVSENPGWIAYIVKSKKLVKKVEEQFHLECLNRDIRNHSVLFITYNEFLQRACNIEKKNIVDKTSLVNWLKTYITNQEKTTSRQDIFKFTRQDLPTLPSRLLFLIKKQSLRALNKNSETNPPLNSGELALEKLLQAYNTFLAKNQQIYPPFYSISASNTLFQMAYVDEAQDLTSIQMKNIYKLTDAARILWCADSHQSLEDSSSFIFYLKALYAQEMHELNIHFLPSSYRCAAGIIALANELMRQKILLVGGISDKEEPTEIKLSRKQQANKGNLRWLTEMDIAPIKEINNAQTIVITGDKFKKEAQKTFPNLLCFTEREAKGLEFDSVIYYRPLDYDDSDAFYTLPKHTIFNEANLRLRELEKKDQKKIIHQSKAQEGKEFVTPYNRLIAAVSRARKNLWIFQPNENKLANVISPLKAIIQEFSGPSFVLKENSSVEEWEEMLEKLINEKRYSQAGQIHFLNLKRTHKALILYLENMQLGLKTKKIYMQCGGCPKEWLIYEKSKLQSTHAVKPISSTKVITIGNGKEEPLESQAYNFCIANNLSKLKKFINSQQDFSVDAPLMKEALVIACERGYETIVNFLVNTKKAYVNFVLEDGRFPLGAASAKGKTAIVKILLNLPKLNLNLPHAKTGNTALHEICRSLNIELFRIFFEHKQFEAINLKIKNKENKTALLVALTGSNKLENRKEIVGKLMHAGININLGDVLPLTLACQEAALLPLVKLIVNFRGFKHIKNKNAIYAAIAAGNLEAVKYLIENKVGIPREPDEEDFYSHGLSPLHMACQFRNQAIIEFLFKKETINDETHSGITPLFMACLYGNISLANYFLKNQAKIEVPFIGTIEDLYLQSSFPGEPFHSLPQENKLKIEKWLAMKKISHIFKLTALDIAKIIGIYDKLNPPPNLSRSTFSATNHLLNDEEKQPLFAKSCIHNNLKVVKNILAEVDPTLPITAEGYTALHFAVLMQNIELTELLLKNEKTVVKQLWKNFPILYLALNAQEFRWKGREIPRRNLGRRATLTEALIAAGADVDYVSETDSLLTLACKSAPETVELLLVKPDVDVNFCSSQGIPFVIIYTHSNYFENERKLISTLLAHPLMDINTLSPVPQFSLTISIPILWLVMLKQDKELTTEILNKNPNLLFAITLPEEEQRVIKKAFKGFATTEEMKKGLEKWIIKNKSSETFTLTITDILEIVSNKDLLRIFEETPAAAFLNLSQTSLIIEANHQERRQEENFQKLCQASEVGDVNESRRLLANNSLTDLDKEKILVSNVFSTNNKKEIIEMLLEHNAKVDAYSWQVASAKNQIDVMKLLLAHNADPNYIYKNDYAPLTLAIQNNSIDAVELLINANADVNKVIPKRMSFLHEACSNGLTEIANLLLKAGADINFISNNKTPLYMACENGHFDLALFLLNRESWSVEKENNSPAFLACTVMNVISQEAFEQKIYADASAKRRTEEQKAVISAKAFFFIKELVTKGIDFKKRHPGQLSVSHHICLLPSCASQRIPILSLLRDKVDFFAAKYDGITPLFVAYLLGDDLLVRAISSYYVKENRSIDESVFIGGYEQLLGYASTITKPRIETFFKKAQGLIKLSVSQLIIILQASLGDLQKLSLKNYQLNDDDKLIFLSRCCNENLEEVKLFLTEMGVNHRYSQCGDTPLHIAVKAKNKVLLKLVLSYSDLTIDAMNKEKFSPLELACQNDDREFILLLLEKNANINQQNMLDGTSLSQAIKNSNLSLVKFLLEKNADVNLGCQTGTPLIEACRKKDDNSYLELLLGRPDIDVNGYCEVNSSKRKVMFGDTYFTANAYEIRHGVTALGAACEAEDKIKVQLLLACSNININLIKNILNPVVIVCLKRNLDLLKLLVAKGANLSARYDFNIDVLRRRLLKEAERSRDIYDKVLTVISSVQATNHYGKNDSIKFSVQELVHLMCEVGFPRAKELKKYLTTPFRLPYSNICFWESKEVQEKSEAEACDFTRPSFPPPP